MSSERRPNHPRSKAIISLDDEHPVCDTNGQMCQVCKEQVQFEELKLLEKELMENEDCEEMIKDFSFMFGYPQEKAEEPDSASRVGRSRNLKTLGSRDRSSTGRTKQAVAKHKKRQENKANLAKAKVDLLPTYLKTFLERTTQNAAIALNDERFTTTWYEVKNLSDDVDKMELH
ncbi:Hypothetical predicted protein [Cloeon dipterum]|uniref:Uncharacterized protein n=1 Tax=Cloeon dipterum TaxID=197152 RepID=A0A8S1DY09_9INSE|nr:Hypothetical predicted protein [Cloeon dipterum]